MRRRQVWLLAGVGWLAIMSAACTDWFDSNLAPVPVDAGHPADAPSGTDGAVPADGAPPPDTSTGDGGGGTDAPSSDEAGDTGSDARPDLEPDAADGAD
jgi:hypothetical protein